jgi:tetratricopeptide (TPR) repeat protein
VPRSRGWDAHHLHFLWYAALMEGRVGLSLQTARDYARRFGNQGDGAGEYAQLLPMATLVRLQRWDDVLAEPAAQQGLGLFEGYASYARGMAYAHTGRLDKAKDELALVQRLRLQPTLQRARMYGEDRPAKLMTLAHDTLAGSIARAERRYDEAAALLRHAADLDDALGNDPPPTGGGARLMLAGALLDAGKADAASKEIAEALRLNGPSAWTHQGLARVAELRGARDEGQGHAEQARAAWKNAQGAALPQL